MSTSGRSHTLARWFRRFFLLSGLLFPVLTGCGSEEGFRRNVEGGSGALGGGSFPVEEWRLSPTPQFEIGVREGDDPYQLHRVRGSVRLDDGRVVVLNAGSQELRYFDESGAYLKSVGGEGEGPGEFRRPASLRRSSTGGLRVWDAGLMRVSRFDSEGSFQELERLLASREELFPGDQWLLGANWIDSPVAPGAREPIRRAVEALPPPDSTASLRILRVTPQGRIWTPNGRIPSDEATTWDVFDLQGDLVARVTTPPRFQVHEIGEDYITGVFLDEVDVNYVRVYGLEKPGGAPVGPGLDWGPSLEGGASEDEPIHPAASDEVMAAIRSLVKNLASLQEIYYSDHFSYTADPDALFAYTRASKPDQLEVDILFAGDRGWAGQVSHPESGGRCILSYGIFVPEGWQPGAVICL